MKDKIIFLLTIKNIEKDIMCLFFDWMLELASNVSKLSALCKASSYEEFINIFSA